MTEQVMLNGLKRERRSWALTQGELALLLGRTASSQISRVENEKQHPGVHLLIASKFLFGIPAERLFPGLYASVEDHLLRQANDLYEKLEGDDHPDSLRKRELLDQLLKQAILRNQQKPNL